MRCCNESIARKANKEDGCKGKFFESRFVSQALLDETALLACLCYLDLNPVRTGMADTTEGSDYTSIQQRINAYQSKQSVKELLPSAGNPREPMPVGIPCTAEGYFDLIDMTARQQRSDDNGTMNEHLPPLLQQLGISGENWLTASSEFEMIFSTFVGQQQAIEQVCKVLSKKWVNMQNQCLRILTH